MIRLKRRNTAWLIAMGLLIGFALLAAPVSAAVQISLLGAFAVAVIASLIELGPDRETLLDILQAGAGAQAHHATSAGSRRAGRLARRFTSTEAALFCSISV